MRPLTIDELKSLEVGDWVWIVIIDERAAEHFKKGYYQKIESKEERENDFFMIRYYSIRNGLKYLKYGKTWLAYKNKEIAEAKGEIVELPCKVGSSVYAIIDKEIITYVARKITMDDYGMFYTRPHGLGRTLQFGHNVFVTQKEAERRLAELKGE